MKIEGSNHFQFGEAAQPGPHESPSGQHKHQVPGFRCSILLVVSTIFTSFVAIAFWTYQAVSAEITINGKHPGPITFCIILWPKV